MEKLKASDDTRITYDEATGAVRSFLGVDLVDPPEAGAARAGRSAWSFVLLASTASLTLPAASGRLRTALFVLLNSAFVWT